MMKQLTRKIAIAAALAVVFAAPVRAEDAKAGDLVITQAWSRATPVGAKVAGAYLTVENKGAAADRLIGGGGEVAGRVEIHEMAMDNGVMKMRPLDKGLDIEPGNYAHSRDGGKSFSTPLAIGEAKRSPSRPFAFAGPHGLALVWKEFDGERTTVNLRTSVDDGQTWSKPKAVAETKDASDHPLLVSDGKRTYLSWMTKMDGYRLIPIEDES